MRLLSAYKEGLELSLEGQLECVGPGWRPLVKKLIQDLFAAGWNGEIAQIKEKFGGLRFYIGSGTDEMFKLIDKAEARSFSICEQCGKPGELRIDRGWWMTLCEECK